MSSSLEQLQAERVAFVQRYEESKLELSQIREKLKTHQDQLSALEERKNSTIEQVQKVNALIQDTQAKQSLVGPELTTRLLGPLEIERRSLVSETQRIDAELTQIHGLAAQIAQTLGPAFQKQQRFEEVIKSLDEMIKAMPAPSSTSDPSAVASIARPVVPHVQKSFETHVEEQRSVRVPLRTGVSFELKVDQESEHNFYTGFTDNISEGGLFIATDQRIDMGTEISFKLELPTLSEALELKGCVRWIRYSDDPQLGSPNGIGVQFLNLELQVKNAIETFVKQRESIFYDD